jgi:perosamine synthetase
MSEINAAVLLGQLERAQELVEMRIKVAKIFDSALSGQSLLKPQTEPVGYKNSYWTYSAVLDTKNPKIDWYKFREMFQSNGGDGYYAAWKLSYNEPVFQGLMTKDKNIWQSYDNGLCTNAEYLQPRMIQLKTNYWKVEEAEQQAEILRKTINNF